MHFQGVVWVMLLSAVAHSAPATRAAVAGVAEAREWLVGLDDADGRVRARSRERLLSLKREDLGALKKAVKSLPAFGPVQRAALKEIVAHVYLTGDSYEKDVMGFLGITMPRDAEGELDVVIEGRMPGFCGFAALEDGDAILNIEERIQEQPIRRSIFTEIIRETKPGTTLHLRVLRRGRTLRIPVTLDARPLDKSTHPLEYEQQVNAMLFRRNREAEEYWEREFGPVMEGKRAGVSR